MLKRMQAEVLFHNPDDVNSGLATLIEQGFDVEILEDEIDEYGPAVFVRARITTDIAEWGAFFDWVEKIVEPIGGETLEAGRADPE
jgi:hypothetical protein